MSDAELVWSNRLENEATMRRFPSHDCGEIDCFQCHELYHDDYVKESKKGCFNCYTIRRANVVFDKKEWNHGR